MGSLIPLFAANWKMNKFVREIPEYVERLLGALREKPGESLLGSKYDVALFPSSTHLIPLAQNLEGCRIQLGAQNVGTAKSGAYTGEVSPAVLREIGCQWALVGHSERRHVYREEDPLILSRLAAALEEGLSVILCVGEVLQERKSGKTFQRVETQLGILKEARIVPNLYKAITIAYEPVWAIGTGENATPQQAQEVHAFIRNWVTTRCGGEFGKQVRVLYGGSVKPENSAAIMAQPDVNGLLVGGASLDPLIFAGVIRNGLKS